MVVVGSLTD